MEGKKLVKISESLYECIELAIYYSEDREMTKADFLEMLLDKYYGE